MDAIEFIHTRYPFSALGALTPLARVVRRLLESATHIADHDRLVTWRLFGVTAEVRARLGAGMGSWLFLSA